MLNFCTLFDSRYMSRGMAMYESLKKHCNNFHLYIFAFDDICYNFFKENTFDHITIISLNEFEDQELLRIKPTRSKGEYCWTCTSSTILYVLNNYPVDNCTYIDADLYFFASPQVLIDEIGNNSILLTEHRYTPEYDQTKTSGKYCVQFMYFKKDARGMKALQWWRERCIEWCYNRMEDGKFGDQKYLDDWTERFEGVHVLRNLGGGVAPWNMQQYTFYKESNKIYGEEETTQKKFQIIFYHFHDTYFISKHLFSTSFYRRKNLSVLTCMMKEYISVIKSIRKNYKSINACEKYFKFKEAFIHYVRVLKRPKRIKPELYLIWYSIYTTTKYESGNILK